jgi:hypothetical protein
MSAKSYYEFAEWVWSVENLITQSVGGCAARSWQEDHISYTWIDQLRQSQRSISVTGLPRPFRIAWDAYKADGRTLEEKHGDIAFLVKQTFPNRSEVTGVAFLEAKRVYKSGAFEKLDWTQLNKQSVNSSSHRLALYDNQDVRLNWLWNLPCVFPYPYFHPYCEEIYHYLECEAIKFATRATVCLSQHALAYGKKNRELYELSIPLSHQLCLRYFMGQDLDYNPRLVSDVTNGVQAGIDFLIVAHVRFGINGEVGEVSTETVDFDRRAYTTPQAPEVAPSAE